MRFRSLVCFAAVAACSPSEEAPTPKLVPIVASAEPIASAPPTVASVAAIAPAPPVTVPRFQDPPPCEPFLYGIGVALDVARARSCYDRAAAKGQCESGSSADTPLAIGAFLRIDGIGGPVDVAGARAILATCFDDVTKSALLDRAKEREAGTKAPAGGDFCKDIGGTTLTMGGCVGIARERAAADEKAAIVALTKDDQALVALAEAATKAYALYAEADADRGSFGYTGGTMHSNALVGIENELVGDRVVVLREIAAGHITPETKPATDVDAALADVKKLMTGKAERALVATSQRSWTAYRTAELAFLTKAVPKLDAAAVTARLAERRANILRTEPERH